MIAIAFDISIAAIDAFGCGIEYVHAVVIGLCGSGLSAADISSAAIDVTSDLGFFGLGTGYVHAIVIGNGRNVFSVFFSGFRKTID